MELKKFTENVFISCSKQKKSRAIYFMGVLVSEMLAGEYC